MRGNPGESMKTLFKRHGLRVGTRPYIEKIPLAVIGSLLCSATTTTAMAQSDRGAESTALKEAVSLEEVIVTAQKRSEDIQEVPVAITALTADFMSNANIETANDIVAHVPNLQVQFPFGETQPVFSIRGQTMADYNSNQASPVSFYVNEAYIGPSFLQGMTLFDLDRIEILRGPQGTLYGKNTSGGAINLVTRGPSFQGAQGDIAVGFGDFGREHARGGAETELVDGLLAVRGAFTYTKTDGHHENLAPGADDLASIDTWSGRFTLRYKGEKLDATLQYSTGESDGQTAAVINKGVVPDGAGGFVDFSGTNGRAGASNLWEGSHNKAGAFTTQFDLAMLTLKWQLANYELTSITSYLESDALNEQNTDGTAFRMLEDDWGTDVEQFTQDLRLVSDYAGPFDFIVGLYYSTDSTDRLNFFDVFHGVGPFQPDFSSGFSTIQDIDQDRESSAVYLHTTYDITDRLSLTAGVRFTNDKGEYDVLGQLGDYQRTPLLNVIVPGSYAPEDAEFDDSEFSGKLGLDYLFGGDSLVYASYSRGYRSSALNGGALFSPAEVGVVEPEFVDAYEVGFKTRFGGSQVQLNGAAFYYDYTNQQLINFIGFQQHLVNAEAAEILGFELEAVAALTERFDIITSVGYLDTEYTDLVLSDTLTADVNDTVDLSGNELIGSPELNFSFAANYVIARSSAGVFQLNLDTVFIDDQWFSAYNDKLNYGRIRSDAHWTSNAKLSWRSADDRFAAALWIKNIEDDDSYTYALNAQAGFGFDFFIVGLPRRMGAEFSVRF